MFDAIQLTSFVSVKVKDIQQLNTIIHFSFLRTYKTPPDSLGPAPCYKLGLVFLARAMDSYRGWETEMFFMSKGKVMMEEILGCARIGVKKSEHFFCACRPNLRE